MRSAYILTAILCLTVSSQGLADPLTRKLVTEALKISGRETLEAGAREAAERTAASAIQRLGGEGAEKLIRSGGYELLEAAAKHGDDVLSHAARVPSAARYIGVCPEQALSLVTRYGDDSLRLEAQVPGMAEKAASLFGRESLPALVKAAPAEATRLMGYAARADTPQTRAALYQAWKKSGGALLTKLDKHKTLILTSGLTVSMIMVADGVQDAIQEVPGKVPDAIRDFSGKTAAGIAAFLAILAGGGVTVLGWWVWLRRPMSKA